MHFILCSPLKKEQYVLWSLHLCPHCRVLCCSRPLNPLMWRSALYQVDPNVSTAPAWRMMVFNPGSVRLVLPHLIGLKQLHMDWTSVVTGWVYVWIISACPPLLIASLIKTGPCQYSLLASRIDLACRLCLREWCFFCWKAEHWCNKGKNCPLALQLTWLQIPPHLLPWKSVAYVQ